MYGSEIWGFENTSIIESFYLKSLKQLLGLRKTIPSYMVYAETGKYPLYVKIKMRMIKYVTSLLEGEGNKLSEIILNIMINDDRQGNEYKWIAGVKGILNDTGFAFLVNQLHNIKPHTQSIEQTLIDQSKQKLNTDTSKCKTYNYIKDKHGMEYYLNLNLNLKCLDEHHTNALLKFRTSNHKLPIELGRYRNIPREDRLCPFCLEVGDEFHFIFKCSKFHAARHKYIDTKYTDRPNMIKFYSLMNTDNTKQLHNLAIFAKIVMNTFN